MAKTEITSGSILIAHIADTHLRDSQYATTRRGLDFFEATKRAVSAACDKADMLVIVGDIFDQARPGPKVIGQLMQIDQMLRERGKVMLSSTGNHDWCSPTWLSTLFPGRVPENGEIPVDASGIIPIDGAVVRYAGFDFAAVHPYAAATFRSHLAEITVQARNADVVLYHNLVADVVPFYAGLQDPLRVDELPISKNNKAWLLGDIHIQGYITRDRPGGGETLIGYPGSLEMCSTSEPDEKSLPLIRLTKDSAVVEDRIPLRIRPSIDAEVRTEADLEALMKRVTAVADDHPVVSVKFDRSLPQTINRLHSTLDAQRAVVRCFPLPNQERAAKRESDGDEVNSLDVEHFVSKRFETRTDLLSVAVDLLHRGETDAAGIVSTMIEQRLANTGLREDAELA